MIGNGWKIYGRLLFVSTLAGSLVLGSLMGALRADEDLRRIFSQFDRVSRDAIDHGAWDALLGAYVVVAENGLMRVDYARFKEQGGAALKAYLDRLQGIDVTKLNRDEQFALWVNLYNAKTVDILLDHYPVKTIRDIDISPGVFADGPWGKKVLEVNGAALSLDDIEHGILRPIWGDPRIHYAVNCASVGCPNLRRRAFSGARLQVMLDAAARDYINSPRGVTANAGGITASSLYLWYARDFGGTSAQVLGHIRSYAAPCCATAWPASQTSLNSAMIGR